MVGDRGAGAGRKGGGRGTGGGGERAGGRIPKVVGTGRKGEKFRNIG